jgi:uncharacterized membrane protein (DUF2068 family)
MPSRTGRHSAGVVRSIALFKLAKGLLLVAVAVGALKLRHLDPPDVVLVVSNRLHLDAYPRFVEALFERSFRLDAKRLAELGAGAFAFGSLFLLEGVGLWLEKRWAEYVTILSTAAFIPVEIHELQRRFDAARVLLLALNAAIVGYLAWRVRAERPARRPGLRG